MTVFRVAKLETSIMAQSVNRKTKTRLTKRAADERESARKIVSVK